MVPFCPSSSPRIKVYCAWTLKFRHRCIILHGYEQAVELRSGHVNRQNSHHKIKERILFVLFFFKKKKLEEPQSPTPIPKTGICASGDRLRFILKSHRRHHPTECTQASQMPPSRASGDGLLSSHHQCLGKTHRNCVKFRWVKDCGFEWAIAKETHTSQKT